MGPFGRRVRRLDPPYGWSPVHYELAGRGGVFYYLFLLWPVILAVSCLHWLWQALATAVMQMLGIRPWRVSAWQEGRETKSLLRWDVHGWRRARRVRHRVRRAIELGTGLYEIKEATLLDRPLHTRD